MGSGGGYLVEFSPGLEEEYTGYLEVIWFLSNVLWVGSIYTFSKVSKVQLLWKTIFCCLSLFHCASYLKVLEAEAVEEELLTGNTRINIGILRFCQYWIVRLMILMMLIYILWWSVCVSRKMITSSWESPVTTWTTLYNSGLVLMVLDWFFMVPYQFL